MMAPDTGFIDNPACLIVNPEIFCIHLVLAEVLYFNRPESSLSCMQCCFSKTDSFYLKALDQFLAEM